MNLNHKNRLLEQNFFGNFGKYFISERQNQLDTNKVFDVYFAIFLHKQNIQFEKNVEKTKQKTKKTTTLLMEENVGAKKID